MMIKSAFPTSVALVASVPADDTFNGKSRVKGNRQGLEGRVCYPSVTGGGRFPFDEKIIIEAIVSVNQQ